MNLILPSHHAVLVVTHDRKQTFDSLREMFLPPLHAHLEHTVLDIDTAREIISWSKASLPKDQKGERACVLSFHTMTLPAQNALLKALEEPQPGVRFVFVTSNKERLADTVLSRMHVISHHVSLPKGAARLFVETSYLQRMKLPEVVALLEAEDEEERKDREGMRAFFLALLEIAQEKKMKPHIQEEMLAMASYSTDPSAPLKSLVEYMALLLPQQKA